MIKSKLRREYIREARAVRRRATIVRNKKRALKRSEIEFQKKEARYRAIVEDQTELICRYDPRLRITFVNGAYSRFFRQDRSELIGHTFWPHILEKDRQKLESHFKTITPETPIQAIEHEVIAPDGTIHWLHWTDRGIYDDKDALLEYQSVGRDITQQKKMEEALTRGEQHLKSLMASATNFAIYRLKFEQTNPNKLEVVFVSSSISKILGLDDPMNFENWFQYMHPDDVGRIIEANRKAFDTYRFNEVYRSYNPRKKEWRWMHAISNGVVDESGVTHYVNGIIIDVTEQKRLEQKLFDYQSRLKALAAEMTKTQERERRRMATELHDRLGQNLATIKFQLEAALENLGPSPPPSNLLAVANLIDRAINDARSLMYDLAPPALYELGLKEGLKWLVAKLERESDLLAHFSINGSRKSIPDEIQHTIYYGCKELLTNVVKHAHAHNVDISLRCDQDFIHLEVKDDGRGFEVDQDTYKLDSQNGFGLFALRERVEHLGGSINFRSDKRHGASVSLRIPFS